MNIEIILDTGGSAVEGINRENLILNIEAEAKKLSQTVNSELTRKSKAAPDTAQGDLEIIQWIIDLLQDPENAKLYARMLILAVNQILDAAQPKKTNPTSDDTKSDPPESQKPVKVRLLGKELLLPATAKVIKKFLESLGDE